MPEKLIIIDGNSIANRAFYGIHSMLTTKSSTPTNAVYGFLNIMLKYMDEINPEYMCVSFDVHAPTFRHLKYDAYKAQRKGMPDELRVQMPIIKEILNTMNICILEKEGFEADDIIGTVSRICDEKGIECNIVTGDKDDLQLASKNTKIHLTTTSKGMTVTDVYDDNAVINRYGVTPTQFIDIKALMGDSSDNIPGVFGIGEKSAINLIMQNKSIENLYENIDSCGAKGAMLQKLKDGKESAFLSKDLATINRNVPMELDFKAFSDYDLKRTGVYGILAEYELKSVIKKLSLTPDENFEPTNKTDVTVKNAEYRIFDDVDDAVISKILEKDSVFYRIYKSNSGLCAISFYDKSSVYIFMCGLFLTPDTLLDAVKPIFESESLLKIGHGIKDDIVLLNSYGIRFNSIMLDTEIAAYIVDPSRSRYELSELSEDYFSFSFASYEETFGKGKKAASVNEADEKVSAEFIKNELVAIEALSVYLCDVIEKREQKMLLYDVEMPLIRVLADMQIEGICLDKESLYEFCNTINKKIEVLTADIYELSGCEFNINSTKQLGEVLFEKLQLPPVKKTKSGYSTDAAVLEKLMGRHPVIEKIIEYRMLNKISSTYGMNLLALVNEKTGRIHSSFNQTVTVTGRISSTEPNMQNIPVRNPIGQEIRKMFIAQGENTYLVDADYSQIELRVLAHIANDEHMKKAFSDGVDIHAVTASQVLNIPLEDVTSTERSRAKAVNFGIVYGIGEYSLAQDLHISVKEAKQYISGYLSHYKGIASYMESIKQKAAEDGYVLTLLNRRRDIPEIRSQNHNIKAFGERVALNTPIQGTAADIIKIAMVKVHDRLIKDGLKTRLILQVHDELILEAPEDELETVKKLLREEMENAYKLSVDLLVEEKSGKSWYETK